MWAAASALLAAAAMAHSCRYSSWRHQAPRQQDLEGKELACATHPQEESWAKSAKQFVSALLCTKWSEVSLLVSTYNREWTLCFHALTNAQYSAAIIFAKV